jgi:bacterioferritin
MKGNEKLVEKMNVLLAEELTAINQYIVHAEMCANWGYMKLHDNFEKRAIDEMKHAEKLIERILFFDGIPVVSRLNDIKIGKDVVKQFQNDHESESDAIGSYNEAIRLAGDSSDFATREILEGILKDEDSHIDGIEEFQDQIEQMGLQIFLSTVIK